MIKIGLSPPLIQFLDDCKPNDLKSDPLRKEVNVSADDENLDYPPTLLVQPKEESTNKLYLQANLLGPLGQTGIRTQGALGAEKPSITQQIREGKTLISVKGTREEKERIYQALEKLEQTETGRELLEDTIDPSLELSEDKGITIGFGEPGSSFVRPVGADRFHPPGKPLPKPLGAEMLLDRNFLTEQGKGVTVDLETGRVTPLSLEIVLAHELAHADRYTDQQNTGHIVQDDSFDAEKYPNKEEWFAQTQIENPIRKELSVTDGIDYGQAERYTNTSALFPGHLKEETSVPGAVRKSLADSVENGRHRHWAASKADIEENLSLLELRFVYLYEVPLDDPKKSKKPGARNAARAIDDLRRLYENRFKSKYRTTTSENDVTRLSDAYQKAYKEVYAD